MAEFGEVNGVFGGVEMGNGGAAANAGTIRNNNLPTTTGFWSSFKAFWLQEIDWKKDVDLNRKIVVELTPYEQKIEDEINEFLHQEITWEKIHDFLFQEISFGRKK